jgi:glycosyltransferase involved in cell wall biosynthesis
LRNRFFAFFRIFPELRILEFRHPINFQKRAVRRVPWNEERSDNLAVRILMGMPDERSAGGPAACEPPFVLALRELGVEVAEEVYVRGAISDDPSVLNRVHWVLSKARTFRTRLAERDFDLVHLNTAFDLKTILRDAATVRLLRSTRAKIFLKLHGSDPSLLKSGNVALRTMARRLLDQVAGIGVLSSEERSEFIAAGVPESKLFIVKNAVTLRPPRGEEQQEGSDPHILFIARFLAAKGLLDVIRACEILKERGVNFRLSCVGDGPVREEAERQVNQRGLRSHVCFTGYISEDEAARFYHTCTALVFPTYHTEGFPIVIFKAVVAGKPILTTRIRAAADHLREPDNCLWVEPRNPEMLADRIHRIFEDARLRQSIAVANRELARQFTPQLVAEEYLAIYRKITGNSGTTLNSRR